MALINCPECGKEVSDQAPACIHCGYPLQAAGGRTPVKGETRKSVNPTKWMIIFTMLFMAVTLLLFFFVF